MLDAVHLGHQVGPVRQALPGAAAGQNEVHLGRTVRQERLHLVTAQEIHADGRDRLVGHDHRVPPPAEARPREVKGLACGQQVVGPRFAGHAATPHSEDLQFRRQPFGRLVFARGSRLDELDEGHPHPVSDGAHRHAERCGRLSLAVARVDDHDPSRRSRNHRVFPRCRARHCRPPPQPPQARPAAAGAENPFALPAQSVY